MPNATGNTPRMADRIADFDWASTPLGPRASWPQSLKTAVDLVLGSGHAMQLAWGPARTVVYNDAYAPMLGKHHPAALGLPLPQAWPDVWKDIEPLVTRVFAGETARYENMPLTLTRNGEPEKTWWNFSYSPVRDESGAIAGLLNVSVDATARKQGEALYAFLLRLSDALRDARELGAIAGLATRMLAQHLDVDRGYLCTLSHQQRLAWISDEYHATGLAPVAGEYRFDDFPEPMRGSRSDLLAIDDMRRDNKLSAHDRAVLESMGLNAVLTGIQRKGDRDQVWALVVGHSRPHTWSRAERMTVEEATERTWAAIERARMDDALTENRQRLEEANRAKDRFLAMLGHELRNPLAPIMTTLQLMQLRAPDALREERKIIESQTRTLVEMVDDLLDVARITRGDLKLQKTPQRVADLVAEAAASVAWALTTHRQTLHTHVEPQLAVLGDRRRLVQVLVNLLVNACKYSPPDRDITLDAAAAGADAVIRVRDQGHGMQPALLARVFEAFTQADQALDRRRGGLGLGLAIVRNIMDLHGGSITAASEGEGRGSEFTLRLPRLRDDDSDRAPEAETTAPASPEPSKAAARILLVDDHVLGAQAMGALLEATGYSVRVEHTGAAALKAAATFAPTLALLDIGLPDMDGYELARALRARPEFARLPLIALTGYGQAEDRARTRDAGFNEHVTKPVRPNDLVALIEKLVQA